MFPAHLHTLINSNPKPVVLLDGSRTVHLVRGMGLANVGRSLAETFPQAIFRGGNALGVDEALVSGVAVPGANVELVMPSRRTGRARRPAGATCKALKDLPREECRHLIKESIAVNPKARPLFKIYLKGRYQDPLYEKARHLLRDALKVIGSPALELDPASVVLLFINAMRGINKSTAHTVRLCQRHNVPVFRQEDWLSLPNADQSAITRQLDR